MLKRKPLKRKYKPKTEEEKASKQEMFKLFVDIWEERADIGGENICFETGKILPYIYKNNSMCYHHCLEKSSFPQYMMNKKNIILVSPEIHNQYHTNSSFCKRILEYREYLLSLHEKSEL